MDEETVRDADWIESKVGDEHPPTGERIHMTRPGRVPRHVDVATLVASNRFTFELPDHVEPWERV